MNTPSSDKYSSPESSSAVPVSRPSSQSAVSFEPLPGVPIERRENLSAEEFLREYAMKNRPVIITDAMKGWAAIGKWTPQFFAENYPSKPMKFRDGQEMTMAEFIDRVLHSSAEKPAPYWINAPLLDHFPELMADIDPHLPYFTPNWGTRHYLYPSMNQTLHRGTMIELYIGGEGGSFPIVHWDGLSSHAFLMQIHGRKRYYAWPPQDSEFMYPQGNPPNLCPVRDVEHPDLEKYPLFAKAHLTTFVLEPGEMLFVPSRWWHTAKMLTPSITISINTWNKSNWSNFVEDMTRQGGRLRGLLKHAYLVAATMGNWLIDLAAL